MSFLNTSGYPDVSEQCAYLPPYFFLSVDAHHLEASRSIGAWTEISVRSFEIRELLMYRFRADSLCTDREIISLYMILFIHYQILYRCPFPSFTDRRSRERFSRSNGSAISRVTDIGMLPLALGKRGGKDANIHNLAPNLDGSWGWKKILRYEGSRE